MLSLAVRCRNSCRCQVFECSCFLLGVVREGTTISSPCPQIPCSPLLLLTKEGGDTDSLQCQKPQLAHRCQTAKQHFIPSWMPKASSIPAPPAKTSKSVLTTPAVQAWAVNMKFCNTLTTEKSGCSITLKNMLRFAFSLV